jgi:hypothetical protein
MTQQFSCRQLIVAVAFAGHLVSLALAQGPAERREEGARVPDFNRDVRPILADKCYKCHGPDEAQRQAELRLDQRDGAFGDLGGHAAVVPGQPDESELIRRVFSEDPDERMPQPDSKLMLTEAEKTTLRQWVAGGAPWSDHWAFIPPNKPVTPNVADGTWGNNEIDAFILTKLERQGLEPSETADPERLLRRVTVDLTGLPPTIEEIDAFLADTSDEAYGRVVDRLLQSDPCAERLALDWMDLARYADSHGMHADGWRMMWPWRDWVIKAYKQNLPYDQFVTWQLAGDLLPDATREQILATAFHRNHPMTAEGGVIDEEFRLAYVFDRAETTATAFLGLTVQCARCHDHKFDPIRQREYYQLAAFFNNMRELGMTGDDGNFGPHLPLPTAQAERDLVALDNKIATAEQRQRLIRQRARAQFSERTSASADPIVSSIAVPDSQQFCLDSFEEGKPEKGKARWSIDGNEHATTGNLPQLIEGIAGQGILIASEYGFLSLQGAGHFDAADPYSAAVWIRPDQELEDVSSEALRTILGTAGQKNQLWRGWEFDLDGENRLLLRLIHRLPDNMIDLRSAVPLPICRWSHVAFAYDGTGRAAGIRLFVDGMPVETETFEDSLTKSIFPVKHSIDFPPDDERAVRVGRSYRQFTGEFGIYRGGVDDIRFFEKSLTDAELATLYASYDSVEAETLEAGGTELEFEHWLAGEHEEYSKATTDLRVLRAERFQLNSSISEVMVMSEMSKPRATHVLYRGEYTQPQEQVGPGTPAAVLKFPADLPRNRLGLARWLFHDENGLTARVAVNRAWQSLFGHGLVRTPHDFGVQGERPTHPELLDWLAVTFRESGWDSRALLKRIVMSSTYRQSSVLRPELQQHDPENRLLGRSPSYRLPAEVIRDHALAASGLLVRRVGGPSVKPYQPEGLWIEKNNFSQYLLNYKTDSGEKLYRRSLYTFIRRTSPPPAMIAFDAPNRSVCTVKREVTNTPLQALVLMNDPQFVEAARAMTEQVQKVGGDSFEDRLSLAFRLLTGRRPRDAEVNIFRELYDGQLKRFEADPDAAEALLSVGDYTHDERLDPVVTAAWTMVTNTLMNYDEFYMKR